MISKLHIIYLRTYYVYMIWYTIYIYGLLFYKKSSARRRVSGVRSAYVYALAIVVDVLTECTTSTSLTIDNRTKRSFDTFICGISMTTPY